MNKFLTEVRLSVTKKEENSVHLSCVSLLWVPERVMFERKF